MQQEWQLTMSSGVRKVSDIWKIPRTMVVDWHQTKSLWDPKNIPFLGFFAAQYNRALDKIMFLSSRLGSNWCDLDNYVS